MKIGGKVIDNNYFEIIPIIKGENEYILKARPVSDFEDFDKVCPKPLPPKGLKKGGDTFEDTENPEYKKKLNEYIEARTAWMCITSLDKSDIEWDTVNKADPTTFNNWREDLKNAGLTAHEINRILEGIFKVQGLDSEKIEEAKKRFLALGQ